MLLSRSPPLFHLPVSILFDPESIRTSRWTRPSASPMSPRARPYPVQNAGEANKLDVGIAFECFEHLKLSSFIAFRECPLFLAALPSQVSGN